MKLLVCDVEGTIFKANYRIKGTDFASTMWQPLAQRLGDDAVAEELETHKKWDNEEYSSYMEWVEATAEIHKRRKLHVSIFEGLIDEAEYNDGVIEFFSRLDRKKYIPVLVSGGFQELVRRAQRELNIKYGYGACEYHFDRETGFLASYTMTPCDFDGKFQYVNALFPIYNLRPNKDWVFIGDGKNDIHIANQAPVKYGINCHPELAKVVEFNAKCFSELYSKLVDDEDIGILDETDFVYDEETDSVALKEEAWKNTLSELEYAKEMLGSKEAEVKSIEVEIGCLNEVLAIASTENQEKEVEILELKTKYAILQKEKTELQKIQQAAASRTEKEEKTRRKEIKDFWNLHFRHFSFTSAFLHEAAKLLHGDRIRLEEKLLQLHEAPDPRILSRSKYHDSGNDHLGLTLLGGVAARVHYKVVHGQPHRVEILELQRKNET